MIDTGLNGGRTFMTEQATDAHEYTVTELTEVNDYISVSDYASQVGRDRSSILKSLKKHGIPIVKLRGPTGQATSHISRDSLNDLPNLGPARNNDGETTVGGQFYLIQVMPDEAPNNITTGFTDDLQRRLAEYRTAWYSAKLLHSVYARRWWEQTIQDAIEAIPDMKRIGEQFVVPDIDAVIERVETIIGLLPKITQPDTTD
jgi:hypothetical protein